MRRPLRCLAWTVADYAAMDAADKIQANPPMISSADLLKIPVGNEMVEDRVVTSDDMAILLKTVASDTALEQAFDGAAAKFPRHYRISIGGGDDAEFVLKVPEFPGAFPLMRNMAVKLFFNSVSTGTMARLGRVTGNWMSFVDCTNKKLLDRGTRLLVEIAKVDYRTACATLFEAMEEIAAAGNNNGEEKASPVQVALKKLGK
jgi:N-acetylmuramic acid 6-phosphate etherase